MNRPFQSGHFDYNECFLSDDGFLSADANEEKHMMGFYLEALTGALSRRKVVFGGLEPVRWLEPGIGDGSSTRRFLQAVAPSHPTGFVVYGSDYQSASVDRAVVTLNSVPGVLVHSVSISVKDAFGGEALAPEKCDFALLSHFVYHLKNQLDGNQITEDRAEEKLKSLIKGIMDSLSYKGLALAFHEGPSSDMFGNIGRMYGAAMWDASERIERATRAIGKTIVSMPLESKLYFPDLSQATIESFKDISNWKAVQERTKESAWLKKLLFALHNTRIDAPDGSLIKEGGVRELAREASQSCNRTRLGDAIDHLVDLFDHDDLGSHITIRSEMQAIVNAPELEAPIQSAFAEVQEALPDIRRRTREALQLPSGEKTA